MVFTHNQFITFLQDVIGMSLATVEAVQAEGITSVNILGEYTKDLLKTLKEDLRRPAGTIPDPTHVPDPQAPNAPVPRVPRPPSVLSALSLSKLDVMADLIRYYDMVGRPIDVGAMRWNGIGQHYQQYMLARCKDNDDDDPALPKISKNLGITLWVDSFEMHLHRMKGCRDVPLAYVLRPQAIPDPPDTRVNRRPYGTAGGSVIGELILRASHAHEMYTHDNNRVFEFIEEALRTTQYSSTLAGFKRSKDGRGAWLAILSQHAGRDKWEKEFKKHRDFITTFKWKGTTNMTLESFVNKHRIAHTRMLRCAQNITAQTFEERERVNGLLDGIISSDPGLQAAMASIRADTREDGTGKQDNFEEAAAYIIPFDPVSKKRGVKRQQYEIGAVKADLSSSKGTTGVELRFYKANEYKCLTSEQKKELKELRAASKSKDNEKSSKESKKKKPKNSKAQQFIAAVTEQLTVHETEQDQEYDDYKDLIIAAMTEGKNDPKATAQKLIEKGAKFGKTVNELKSILKRNGKDVGGK